MTNSNIFLVFDQSVLQGVMTLLKLKLFKITLDTNHRQSITSITNNRSIFLKSTFREARKINFKSKLVKRHLNRSINHGFRISIRRVCGCVKSLYREARQINFKSSSAFTAFHGISIQKPECFIV